MNGNYGAIGKRNRKKPDYWTPRFISGVFDESSYPVNRANRAYEIAGMQVSTGQLTNNVGTFVFNNGDVAIFNSQGLLIEILGDPGEGDSSPSVASGAFLDTWTPELSPGTFISFVEEYEFNEVTPVFENDNSKLTVTGTDQGGYFLTQEFIPLNNDNNGVAFKLGSAADNPEFPSRLAIIYVVLIPAGQNIDDLTSMHAVALGKNENIGANNNSWILHGIGDFANEDSSSFEDPIEIVWSPDLELTISYDRNASTYGTIHLYTNDGPDGTLIASHDYSALYTPPARMGVQIYLGEEGETAEATVEIVNTPTFEIADVTYHGGGGFDTSSYPPNRAGKAFTVTGLTESVDVPYIGSVSNGDMVFFNSSGLPQGRPWGRDDISNLSMLEDLIQQSIGRVGVQTWVPRLGTADRSCAWYGTHMYGDDLSTYVNINYDTQANFKVGSNISFLKSLSAATDYLFNDLPTTIKGITFQLYPAGFGISGINSGSFRAGFGTGISGDQEYDPEGIIRRYFEMDIENGIFTNTRFYWDSDGKTHPVPLSFSMGDVIFFGVSKTHIYIKNITTNEEYSYDTGDSYFLPNVGKRFFSKLEVDQSAQFPSEVIVIILSNQNNGPYPYIGESQPTPYVDNGALPSPRGNRSFEVVGLGSYGLQWYPGDAITGYPTTIKNGDIVVFNKAGFVVDIMHAQMPPA